MYEEDRVLAKKYEQLKNAQTQYLQQKCKMGWLKEGDMNTKYFHSVIKAKRNQSRVFAVKDICEIPRRDDEEISKAFIKFLQ